MFILRIIYFSTAILIPTLNFSSTDYTDNYCNPWIPVDVYSFNFSCLRECLFDYDENDAASRCDFSSHIDSEFFAEEYLKVNCRGDGMTDCGATAYSNNRIVVFRSQAKYMISLNSEMFARYSFEGLTNFSCQVHYGSLKIRETMLERCYHDTE